MMRAEAIADLQETFGQESVVEQTLAIEPGFTLVIIAARQPIPNGSQSTQVALKLPVQIVSRPQHYVEPHLVLRDGRQPNNVNTQELNGRLWKTWSMNTSWDPVRHTMTQLVYTVLKQWDR
jgi:hypothetical protein